MTRVLYDQPSNTWWDAETERQLSPAEAGAMQEAESNSGLGSFLVGAGKTFQNMLEGVDAVDPIDDETAMMAQRDINPISTMAGEAAPMMAPIPGGLAAQAIGSGALGYLGSDEGDRAGGAALGAAGGVAGHMVGRVLSRAAGVKKQELAMMGQAARDVTETGGYATTGQALGSDSLKTVERGIQTMPFGKSVYRDTLRGNQQNVDRLAREALEIGPGKAFGDDAMDAAADVVSKKYAALEGIIPEMEVPAGLADDLRVYLGSSSRLKSTLAKKGAQNFDGEGPMTVSSDSLLDMRSRILKRNKTPSNDSPIYEDIIESIDDLIEVNAGPEAVEAFADARSHYRLLKTIEKSRTGNSVSPAKLANRMKDWDPGKGAKGDLRRNVRGLTSSDFTNQFGNSGTADALSAILGLPMSPLTVPLGMLLNSALDVGNAATRTGAALGRGAAAEDMGLLEMYRNQ